VGTADEEFDRLPITLPPAAAGAQRLTGASRGTQEWHQTDGHCPDLDHTQDETVTMADDGVWQYHADFCGDVEGTQWHGDGTFGLTDPGGDSLTGTISVGRLTMGTSGSPRLITVTGGTGAWAGATGSCLVDETVQVSSFTYIGTSCRGTHCADASLAALAQSLSVAKTGPASSGRQISRSGR
jgi:hypothetical protein